MVAPEVQINFATASPWWQKGGVEDDRALGVAPLMERDSRDFQERLEGSCSRGIGAEP